MSRQSSFHKLLMYGCMTAVSLSLLLSSVADANNVASSEARLTGIYKVGDKVTLKLNTVYFSDQLTKNSDLHHLKTEYYGTQGESFQIDALSGEMVRMKDSSRGILWIPSWYLTKESASTKVIAPKTISMKSKRNIFLAPEGALKWSEAGLQNKMVAVTQWKDWYGVLVGPDDWYRDDMMIYRPALFWVRAKDVEAEKTLPDGLWNKDLDVSSDLIRELTSYKLRAGDSTSSVQKLLGTPKVKETSSNLQMEDNGPMQLGESWRYERADAQFIVTFGMSGKLEHTQWILPSIHSYREKYSAGDDYFSTYNFVTQPLTSTLAFDPVWRNQGDLNFTYLLGGNEDILLLRGDDGGFSGMHHNSSLYALERSSGEKLWQQNAGFGWFTSHLDLDKQHVTMYSAYNPDKKEYEDRVRHIRLSDGKTMWEMKLKQTNGTYRMSAANKSIIIEDSPSSLESRKGGVIVLDSETGKIRWKKTLPRDVRILNQGMEDPYVLIQEGKTLKGYDPLTGKVAWTFKVKGIQLEDPAMNPYFTGGARQNPLGEAGNNKRWTLLGEEWVLLNTNNGKSEAVYSAKSSEQFEVLNDSRYLLVRRGIGGAEYSSAQRYESALYDAVKEREVWRIQGRATKAVLEDDTIYLAIDGTPTAMDKETGKVLWKMKMISNRKEDLSHLVISSFAVLDQYLLLEYGSDLVVLGKEDGSLLGRLHNVRAGSAELREQQSRNGALNVFQKEIYVGTANGGFVRYDAEALEEWMEQIERGE
ncbi:PQQ-binding-like beta-propeller repeat protein [Paenibacillus sp. EC2-1]|uniref:outer membrane protein assembly factor BamB family protein n=1 Tax=Paenibacillus sp. EC2-1 TaxID=3388665 RepID=UPI003BEF32DF